MSKLVIDWSKSVLWAGTDSSSSSIGLSDSVFFPVSSKMSFDLAASGVEESGGLPEVMEPPEMAKREN